GPGGGGAPAAPARRSTSASPPTGRPRARRAASRVLQSDALVLDERELVGQVLRQVLARLLDVVVGDAHLRGARQGVLPALLRLVLDGRDELVDGVLVLPLDQAAVVGVRLARLLRQLLQLLGRRVTGLDQLLRELVVDVARAQERRQRPGRVLVVPDLLVVLVQLLGLGGEGVERLLHLIRLAAELQLLLLKGL